MLGLQKKLKENFGNFLLWEIESRNDAFSQFYKFPNNFGLVIMFSVERTYNNEFITWITVKPIAPNGKILKNFSSPDILVKVQNHDDMGYFFFGSEDEQEIITFIKDLQNYFETEKNS